MTVNFTSNLGLAYTNEAELALNWARSTKLAEDNNTLIKTEMDKTLISYTPTLKAHTSDPNIGSTGTILGEYQEFLGLIQGMFLITFNGTGVSAGSGEYGVSLPFPVDDSFHTDAAALNSTPGITSVIGEGYMYDASAAATSGGAALDVVTVGGISYVRFLTEAFTSPVKTSRMLNEAQPFACAANDRLIGNFFYKKA